MPAAGPDAAVRATIEPWSATMGNRDRQRKEPKKPKQKKPPK
jgi:hypothetical protein